MTAKRMIPGLLSVMLAAALFLTPLSARAEELSEETAQAAAVTETTASPTETTPVTQPVETTVPTEPPETVPPAQPTVPETTEATQPPETTEVTQPAVETEPEASTELEPPAPTVTPVTVSQAWAMPTGTANITIRGTVVYASGTQAILQDSTGGIRLSFAADPGTVPGEVLQVTGRRSGGFLVEDFESLGTASLPAVETTLLDAPENTRVHIRQAKLGYNQLSQDGFSLTMIASLPQSAAESEFVEVYGVILDGRFYADAVYPQTASFSLRTASEEPRQEWNIYFGQLHAHTSLSDGLGTVTEVFSRAAQTENLDFFAVTDHSDSFDNAGFADIAGENGSNDWTAGKNAARKASNESFVAIFGYEMSWPEGKALGHISTFNTPGFQSWKQAGMESLEGYYEALTRVPGSVSQFNHPGHVYGNFHFFDYHTPEYDEAIHLIEVGGREDPKPFDYYIQALDAGWHLAPANNQDGQQESWTDAGTVRTAVLAKELTEDAIYEAIRSHRVYATQDSDLEICYYVNDRIMGSILGPSESLQFRVSVRDITDEKIGTLEVIAQGGEVLQKLTVSESAAQLDFEIDGDDGYYFLRITQPDGDTAVTAPVWVDSYEDAGIAGFSSDVEQPMEEQPVTLTLELYNHEDREFVIERLEFLRDGQLLHSIDEPGVVSPLGSLSYPLPFVWEEPGEVQLTAKVTGTVAGYTLQEEKDLTLRYQAKDPSFVTIAQARAGITGEAYHIKGYVTAGNQNIYNTFPNTLYLQDDTGGIAVTGFAAENIQVGTPMEVTGVLRKPDGNLTLELTDFNFPQETYYRYVPRTMTHAVAMDYAAHGGELLQVEGTVVSLLKTKDGKGISRMTLKDVRGDLATVLIEEEITSGAYGTNELAAQIKKGRSVRAMGLLHVDEFGETVLRVRNCDEVVYVPPKADPTNPKTGDAVAYAMKFAFGKGYMP